jgi:predicted enzyme related to lactoylglutathione lyase
MILRDRLTATVPYEATGDSTMKEVGAVCVSSRWKICAAAVLAAILAAFPASAQSVAAAGAPVSTVAVGSQYDSTHVYVAPADIDAFVASFVATFGGQPSKRGVANVLPVPSSTETQYVWTAYGTLSVFAFETPIPFPFGEERTGYLVTNMDDAIRAARAAGAEVIVEPFKDPIGIDAVIQWPGGVKMQLYWHTSAPSYAPLKTVPDNRVYVSRDAADTFLADFVKFSHGKIIEDDARADAGEIGRPGETYRRIRITSGFGNMQVLVTDGHLPFPFGREISGYEVPDLDATLQKAKAAGAKLLAAPYTTAGRTSALVQFPGGYIAEIHSAAVTH